MLHLVTHNDTDTHTVGFPGGGISPTYRPVPDKTQHSYQINIHTPSGIRTRNLSRQAAADPHLRTRGHWDRQVYEPRIVKSLIFHRTGISCVADAVVVIILENI